MSDRTVYELIVSELNALSARIAAIERAVEDLWQTAPAAKVSAVAARRAREKKACTLRPKLAAARVERIRKVKR